MTSEKITTSVLVVLASLGFAATAGAEPLNLTILHYNDMDRMEEDGGQGGFARLMAVVKAETAGDRTVLLTHGGDAISPSLLSGFDDGAHIIDLINQTPTAIFVPGNHEFDFGPDIAKKRLSEAKFPIVASNVIQNGAVIAGARETYTMEVGDYTLGFIGLTTPDTAELASPGDVTFAPILDTTARLADQLRADGADLVIALAHVAIDEDMALIQQGAVDLVLGGHDHLLLTFYDGRIALVESASQADYVTAVDLVLDRDKDGDVTWTPSFRTLNTAAYQPDEEMAAKVQAYLDRLSSELDIEVGTTETPLDSRRATVRGGEAAIGNLIADAIRAAVGADVAITNGGGIRADRQYEAGTVLTRRDIQSELPFGNKTVKLEATGEQIMKALENGFSQVEEAAGRFPHVSGMTVTADLSKAPGQRVQQVLVGGKPLDLAATYTVATNDYMASGGDGYTAFAGTRNLIDPAAANFMSSQVMDYVAKNSPVRPAVEGRITMRR